MGLGNVWGYFWLLQLRGGGGGGGGGGWGGEGVAIGIQCMEAKDAEMF